MSDVTFTKILVKTISFTIITFFDLKSVRHRLYKNFLVGILFFIILISFCFYKILKIKSYADFLLNLINYFI